MPAIRKGHSVARAADERHRRVLAIAKEVSATIGTDFFNSVVKHLAASLSADCVYIAELTEAPWAPIRSLAFHYRGESAAGFEQKTGGTAAGQVLADGAFSCARDARRFFPFDGLLNHLQAEAYTGIRLCDSAGHPLGLIAVASRHPARDISLTNSVLEAFRPRVAAELERKVSDDRLKESEERYRAFVQCNSDAMWRIEFEQPIEMDLGEEETVDRIYLYGYLAECNEATATLFGFDSPEALVGTRFGDFASRTDLYLRQDLGGWIRSGFRSSTVETMRLDERSGIRYRLRTVLGIVKDGRLLRVWGSTRDVTEARRSTANAQYPCQLLDKLPMPAVFLDVDGIITYCNASLAEIAQRSPEELLGKSFIDTLVPMEERDLWRARLNPDADVGMDRSTSFSSEVLTVNSSRERIAWHAVVLRSEDDRVSGLAAVGSLVRG